MNIGDFVINKNDLTLRKYIDNKKYAITMSVYKILSTEEDGGGYIKVLDVNTNETKIARKNCLVNVY